VPSPGRDDTDVDQTAPGRAAGSRIHQRRTAWSSPDQSAAMVTGVGGMQTPPSHRSSRRRQHADPVSTNLEDEECTDG